MNQIENFVQIGIHDFENAMRNYNFDRKMLLIMSPEFIAS